MTPQLKSAFLRIGFFVFIAFVTYFFFAAAMLWILPDNAIVIIAVFSNFAAAAIANALALRTFERGRLADIGLGWTTGSRRNLSIGLLGGIGAAIVVLLGPVVLRGADLARDPSQHFAWPSLLFFSLILLFGAIGEEMLFRGYAFQVFMAAVGPFAAILPVAVLFGFMHASNPGFTVLAGINTFLWGVLLGYSFLRSGDLWLPIGLHFGWNWTLPLLGVNLSGLTMGMTGYTMRWRIGGLWSGGAYGIEGGLFTTAIVVALYFYLEKAPIEPQQPYLLYKDRS